MKKFYYKHEKFFKYSIYGMLASLLNLLIFHVLIENFHIYYLTANIVAYIIAMLFTFFTNKRRVFNSPYRSFRDTWQEFLSFTRVRLLSFILDNLIMIIGIHLAPNYPDVVKIIDQTILGVLNYYFSKWFIFHTVEKIRWHDLKNKYQAVHHHKK